MKKIEKFFDINMVLMTIFAALEGVRTHEQIELVYDIDTTIPKELKGDVETVTHLLSQLLKFVFQNTPNHEVILHLRAPEDFLYQEFISFEVEDTHISKEKAESFFEARLKLPLEKLDGEVKYEEETSKITVSVPFKLQDIGNRRYYRLPDIGMLGKKVLIISKSKIVANSLKKMFKYFLYEVDVGAEEYKKRGSNLAHYDIFVLDEALVTEGIEQLVRTVQKEQDFKFVVLQDVYNTEVVNKDFVSASLVKPVMQESIFELIISLFEKDVKERKIKKEMQKPVINMEKYIIDAFRRSEEAYMEAEEIAPYIPVKNSISAEIPVPLTKEEESSLKVLNREYGQDRCKQMGVDYVKELESYVEAFGKSDYYFREIVKNKASWQIKEFAIDLEKRSKQIGAERMAKIAERIGLLFVYDNLDMLPVYTGKFHLELKKLLKEIETYLKK